MSSQATCSYCKKLRRLCRLWLLLCSHSHNDVPPEPQRNRSMAAVGGAMRPSTDCVCVCVCVCVCACACVCVCVCVCVYSNSRNDVSRVAQWYGTIAAHTRRRASVLASLVVFCVHMHSFAGLIRRTPPPSFSDIAITDRHSDTTIFQLRAHWVRMSWSIRSEKSFGHVPPVGVEPLTSCVQGEHHIN